MPAEKEWTPHVSRGIHEFMVEVVPREVIQHDAFRDWLLDLRDGRARARIAMRVHRMEMGNPGEFKPLGDG